MVQQEFSAFFQQLLDTAAIEIPRLDTEIERDGPCLDAIAKTDDPNCDIERCNACCPPTPM